MNVKAVAIRKGSRALLHVRKVSPELMTGLGIVGVVTSAVFAARATLKLEATNQEMVEERDLLKSIYAEGQTTEKQYKKDLTKVYFTGYGNVAKLYAPSVGLGLLSIGLIAGGQTVSHKRIVGYAAALKASELSFNDYRAKVVEKLGEDEERELRTGLRVVEQKGDDGEVEKLNVFDPSHGNPSIYSRYFDEMNHNWQREASENLFFLRQVQETANWKFQTRGHLFLNEVYDMLGFDRTGPGAMVGWVAGNDGKDQHIDFGLYAGQTTASREFVNGGNQPVVLLDFNVDGVIWDLIDGNNR